MKAARTAACLNSTIPEFIKQKSDTAETSKKHEKTNNGNNQDNSSAQNSW